MPAPAAYATTEPARVVRALSASVVLPAGDGLAGAAWSSGQPAWVTGEGALAVAESRRPWLADNGWWTGMAVPLRAGSRLVGALAFFCRQPVEHDPAMVEVVTALATQLAIVLQRLEAENRAARQALHDPVTRLPNRPLFLDRLAMAMRRATRHPSPTAVLCVGLDHFKRVNDALGHDAGDRVLQQVARRLSSGLRQSDSVNRPGTVARMTGDEFTVLCDELSAAADARVVAERLRQLIAAPFDVESGEVHLSASIGIALADPEVDDPQVVIRNAEAAMYRAKERGRARVEVFDPALHGRSLARLETEAGLRRALVRDELRVFYQPTIDLRTGTVVGAEALVRWEHPTRGLVAPGEFISVAEEAGLIEPIGEWVLGEACRQLARWETSGAGRLAVSVNVSGRQLGDERLLAAVADALERADVDPALLALEITESVLMEDAETVVTVLNNLKSLGVRLEVDDFGTGYSSLSYLSRFPLDGLKIDRSFVSGLDDDGQETKTILRSVLGLADAMGLRVVAEGVETHEQLDVLRRLGCRFAQGYHWSRPLPADELAGWLITAR